MVLVAKFSNGNQSSVLSPHQCCLPCTPSPQSTAWELVSELGTQAWTAAFRTVCHSKESERNIPEIVSLFILSTGSIPSHKGFKRKLTYLLCPLQVLQSVLWWWHIKERGTEVHKSCYKFLSTKNHYLSPHSISLLLIFCALQNLFSSSLW